MNFKIGHRIIGDNARTFIVAEISSNHGHNYNRAVALIKKAKECGADAVKLQTSHPDNLTLNIDNKYFKINDKHSLWNKKTLYELYTETYTPVEWQPKLKKLAENIGLLCFSTPFDKTAVDFLEQMKTPAYKIGSFEITDIPLIEYVASKKKPVIISTGVATIEDIKEAIQACKRKGNSTIALLKCVSTYPTRLPEVNLASLYDLKRRFHTIVGISDHSLSVSVPVASVAIGAKIIEKHLILDRKKYPNFPDSGFSLEPQEFKQMVTCVREAEIAMGDKTYRLTANQKKMRDNFSRSLFVVQDVAKGEVFTEENIKSIRPGWGLHPRYLNNIAGKRTAKKDIRKGTPLSWELLK
ncbi:MAG TPA: pseudaminic acid synthase [Candidatus Thermoplasmatota archaeon]|nr:pseudaminic acid synthase [Candidatus Thermoplasmatota archaeon]